MEKNYNKKKWITIGLIGSLLCIAVCITTGCAFLNKQTPKQFIKHIQKENKYKYFAKSWNSKVIAITDIKNNSYYILDENNETKFLQDLNKLLSPLNNIESRIRTLTKCIKNKDKSIYLPLVEYIDYLNSIKPNKPVNFTLRDTDKQIEATIKDIFKVKYLDKDFIKKLIFINSFEYYFKTNLKDFHKKGVTRNIKKFDQYKKICRFIT